MLLAQKSAACSPELLPLNQRPQQPNECQGGRAPVNPPRSQPFFFLLPISCGARLPVLEGVPCLRIDPGVVLCSDIQFVAYPLAAVLWENVLVPQYAQRWGKSVEYGTAA